MEETCGAASPVTSRRFVRILRSPFQLVSLIALIALLGSLIPAVGGSAAGPALFPDLRTPPPSQLYIERGSDGIYRLRFSNTVANYGGRLEIAVDGNRNIYQNVYDQQVGGTRVWSQRVGTDLIFHPTHNHFHFQDFARYDLMTKDKQGVYRRAPQSGSKTSFCIFDFQRINAPGPSQPQYATCGATVQGLSGGWSDTYYAELPEQWVELGRTMLADGDYAIRSIADPYDRLRESDETNNMGITYFSIQNGRLVTNQQPVSCVSNPDTGPVGITVTLSCQGFNANEQVTIHWGGPNTAPHRTVTATSSGSASGTIVIPEGDIGNHYILAKGASSGKQSGALFNTRPSVVLSPVSGAPGTSAGFNLYGFSDGESVRISYEVSPGKWNVVATVPVNSKGSGSGSFAVPASRFGAHTVAALGLLSNVTVTSTFSVTPSVQAIPNSAASGSQVGISLRGFGGPEQVRLTIQSTGQTLGVVTTSNTGSTTAGVTLVTIPATLSAGSYTIVATGLTTGGSATNQLNVTVANASLAEEPTETPTEEAPATPGAVETEPANSTPVADAGEDQTVEDVDGDGFEEVELNGSLSVDPDGDALTARWTTGEGDDEEELADEIVKKVILPVGTHVIKLTVTDGSGATDDDEVTITIKPAGSIEPAEEQIDLADEDLGS